MSIVCTKIYFMGEVQKIPTCFLPKFIIGQYSVKLLAESGSLMVIFMIGYWVLGSIKNWKISNQKMRFLFLWKRRKSGTCFPFFFFLHPPLVLMVFMFNIVGEN